MSPSWEVAQTQSLSAKVGVVRLKPGTLYCWTTRIESLDRGVDCGLRLSRVARWAVKELPLHERLLIDSTSEPDRYRELLRPQVILQIPTRLRRNRRLDKCQRGCLNTVWTGRQRPIREDTIRVRQLLRANWSARQTGRACEINGDNAANAPMPSAESDSDGIREVNLGNGGGDDNAHEEP